MPGCRMRGGPALEGQPVSVLLLVLGLVIGLAVGAALGYFVSKSRVDTRQAQARADARSILEDAEREVETKRREADLAAKESSLKIKDDAEAEVRARRAEIARVEERLDNRDTALQRREGELDERRRRLSEAEEAMRGKEDELREREADQLRMLEEISGLTREDAERRLFTDLESELEGRLGRMVRDMSPYAAHRPDVGEPEAIATAVARSDFGTQSETEVIERLLHPTGIRR